MIYCQLTFLSVQTDEKQQDNETQCSGTATEKLKTKTVKFIHSPVFKETYMIVTYSQRVIFYPLNVWSTNKLFWVCTLSQP